MTASTSTPYAARPRLTIPSHLRDSLIESPRRGPRRAIVLRVLLVLAVLVAVAVIALRMALPTILRDEIERAVHTRCPACTFQIGAVDLSLVRGVASARAIHLRTDPRVAVMSDIHIDDLSVRVDLASLLRHTRHVHSIAARGVRVIVTRNPALPRVGKDVLSAQKTPPAVRVDSIAIDDGAFTVVDRTPQGAAVLEFADASVRAGPIVDLPSLASDRVTVDAHLVVQHRGDLTVHARIDPFSTRGDLDADLRLEHLDIDRLDRYVRIRESVRAYGEVDAAHAVLHVRDGRIEGSLEGRFHRLRLDFEHGPRRSTFAAAAETAFGPMVYRTDNEGGPYSAQVSGERTANEDLFSFVWRELFAAAKTLAMRNDR